MSSLKLKITTIGDISAHGLQLLQKNFQIFKLNAEQIENLPLKLKEDEIEIWSTKNTEFNLFLDGDNLIVFSMINDITQENLFPLPPPIEKICIEIKPDIETILSEENQMMRNFLKSVERKVSQDFCWFQTKEWTVCRIFINQVEKDINIFQCYQFKFAIKKLCLFLIEEPRTMAISKHSIWQLSNQFDLKNICGMHVLHCQEDQSDLNVSYEKTSHQQELWKNKKCRIERILSMNEEGILKTEEGKQIDSKECLLIYNESRISKKVRQKIKEIHSQMQRRIEENFSSEKVFKVLKKNVLEQFDLYINEPQILSIQHYILDYPVLIFGDGPMKEQFNTNYTEFSNKYYMDLVNQYFPSEQQQQQPINDKISLNISYSNAGGSQSLNYSYNSISSQSSSVSQQQSNSKIEQQYPQLFPSFAQNEFQSYIYFQFPFFKTIYSIFTLNCWAVAYEEEYKKRVYGMVQTMKYFSSRLGISFNFPLLIEIPKTKSSASSWGGHIEKVLRENHRSNLNLLLTISDQSIFDETQNGSQNIRQEDLSLQQMKFIYQHIRIKNILPQDPSTVKYVLKILLKMIAKQESPLWIVPYEDDYQEPIILVGVFESQEWIVRQNVPTSIISAVSTINNSFSKFYSQNYFSSKQERDLAGKEKYLQQILARVRENIYKCKEQHRIIILREYASSDSYSKQQLGNDLEQIKELQEMNDNQNKYIFIQVERQALAIIESKPNTCFKTNSKDGKFQFIISVDGNSFTKYSVLYPVKQQMEKLEELNLIKLLHSQCFNYFGPQCSIPVPGVLQYAKKLGEFTAKAQMNNIPDWLKNSLFYL